MYTKNISVNKKIAFVALFNFMDGGHGAAELSKGIYKSIKNTKKKYYQFNEKKIFIKNKYFISILKFIYVFIFYYKISLFFKNTDKKILIVEGASWIGYSFTFLILTKLLFSKIIFIYHAHNIEYDIRKKQNFLIKKISFFCEKYIYKKSDIATAVSKTDKIRIKKLYNCYSTIFQNGVSLEQLKISKSKNLIKKKYYMYCGTYLYKPNKLAINKLIKFLHPIIKKKYPDLILIITGRGLPTDLIKNKDIIYFPFLKRDKLNKLITESEFLLYPLANSPGTKLKIIDGLVLGKQIITNFNGIKGINIISKMQPYVYKNKHDLFKFIKHIRSKQIKISKQNKLFSKKYKKIYLIENILKKFLKNNAL